MALVLNASAEDQTVKIRGNYFNFKPGQIKVFEDSFAHFMVTDRAYLGLVDLPEDFADPAYKDTEPGKAKLLEKTTQGIASRTKFLREIIYNNEVSLRSDLEKSNIKVDPKVYASDGEVRAYQELLKYQRKEQDENQKRVELLKDLEKQVKEG